jgi:hypothetical protein
MLHQGGDSYALAMYCGGLAVECLLRAFRWTEDSTFEGRHDLSELLKASRLLEFHESHLRQKRASERDIQDSGTKLRIAVDDVRRLWNNTL